MVIGYTYTVFTSVRSNMVLYTKVHCLFPLQNKFLPSITYFDEVCTGAEVCTRAAVPVSSERKQLWYYETIVLPMKNMFSLILQDLEAQTKYWNYTFRNLQVNKSSKATIHVLYRTIYTGWHNSRLIQCLGFIFSGNIGTLDIPACTVKPV